MATSAKNETTCGYNGHYHLYMAIKVNSQNASTNQSNVTVTMYAQSDSSSYGAYNLDASGNSVKMTVNNNQVISKTMAMDFRNRATVNLGSWTGNISHGADGKRRFHALVHFQSVAHPTCQMVRSHAVSCLTKSQGQQSRRYQLQQLHLAVL